MAVQLQHRLGQVTQKWLLQYRCGTPRHTLAIVLTNAGLAVIAGAVSDSLVVRDFDEEEDYVHWSGRPTTSPAQSPGVAHHRRTRKRDEKIVAPREPAWEGMNALRQAPPSIAVSQSSTPRSSVSEKHGEVGVGIHKKINLPQEVLELG